MMVLVEQMAAGAMEGVAVADGGTPGPTARKRGRGAGPRAAATGGGAGRRGLRGVPTESDPGDTGLSSVEFSEVARRLGSTCRRLGFDAPEYRSPGGRELGRTLRRRPDGSVVVSVGIRRRPPLSVVADMIDGALAANRLVGRPDLRDELWLSVEHLTDRSTTHEAA